MRRSLHDAWWRLVSKPPRSPLAYLLTAILQLGSGLYRLGVEARNHAYGSGWLKTERLPCPVISVGNLTVGGTGKTPCVEALAGWLQGQGRRVAILSRGYGGSRGAGATQGRDALRGADASKGRGSQGQGRRDSASAGRGAKPGASATVLMAREGRLFADDAPLEDGSAWPDEPQLLASHLERVPIVIGSNRVETGWLARERLGADVVVLDDGFQHRRLARDCDVVLIDAGMPLDGWPLLPAGPMREPLRALRRADVIVLTKADQAPERLAAWRETLPRLNERALVATAVHEPLDAIDARTGQASPVDRLAGRAMLALSSIGNPRSFEQTLTTLGVTILGHAAFPDHQRLSANDWRRVAKQAAAAKAEAIVTTEKDLVRLRPLLRAPGGLPVWVLRIRMRWLTGEEALRARLAAVCAR